MGMNKSQLNDFIKEQGNILEVVSFGATRYDVMGISALVDNDCMSTTAGDDVRYLILRPNCHLYTKWDKEGSILF